MHTSRQTTDDLLDLARALLLLQGALLVATTIEALIWGTFFPVTGGPIVLSGAAAVMLLIARVRLRADRRWPRRLAYAVEGLTLAVATVDIVLAIALTRGLPPLVVLLTQVALPLSVIVLLRRSARVTAAPLPVSTTASVEVAS